MTMTGSIDEHSSLDPFAHPAKDEESRQAVEQLVREPPASPTGGAGHGWPSSPRPGSLRHLL
jgi:hypothetical protein